MGRGGKSGNMSGINQFSLKDNVIIVTGGRSRYGQHIVTDVAEAGAKVIATTRSEEPVDKITAHREQRLDIQYRQLDLEDLGSIQEFCTNIKEEFQLIDGLVNNAVARPMAHLDDNIEAWKKSMECNATGVFELTRQLGKSMCDNSGGSIVNVSSIQGMRGPDESLYEGTDMYEGQSPPPDYFFHKGGLINLTRYFASVFGADGVRANCVSPGGIAHQDQKDSFVENYERRTTLKRLAHGKDLSGVVIFLLSDAASYVTGTNIPVDGGYSSK